MNLLFGDYHEYLQIYDEIPIVKVEEYLNTKKITDKRYFSYFLETQSFNFFLQFDVERAYPLFFNLRRRKYSNYKKRKNTIHINRSNYPKLKTRGKVKKQKNYYKQLSNFSLCDENILMKTLDIENEENKETDEISLILKMNWNEIKETYYVPPFFIEDKQTKSNFISSQIYIAKNEDISS